MVYTQFNNLLSSTLYTTTTTEVHLWRNVSVHCRPKISPRFHSAPSDPGNCTTPTPPFSSSSLPPTTGSTLHSLRQRHSRRRPKVRPVLPRRRFSGHFRNTQWTSLSSLLRLRRPQPREPSRELGPPSMSTELTKRLFPDREALVVPTWEAIRQHRRKLRLWFWSSRNWRRRWRRLPMSINY